MQRPSVRARISAYGVALLLCGASIVVRAALSDVVAVPFLTLFPAVMLSGWWGGVGPALLSVAVTAAASQYLWVPPYFQFIPADPHTQVELLLFVAVSATIGVVTARLHAVERRFRSVLEATNDGYAIVDRGWRCTYVNRRFASLMSTRRSAVLGRRLWDAFPGVAATRLAAQAREAMEHGRHDTVVEYYEPLGRWLDTAIYPIPAGIALLVRDVSAEKELEVRRGELLAHLQRANVLKDEFLATLSHEMRTPLNALMGWAAMLESGVVSPDRAAASVLKNAEALKALVDDLLDTSSIVQGKLHITMQPTDFTRVVQDALDTVRGTVRGRHLEVAVASPDQPLWVMGDASRLRQVVVNLLSNAVKFTPEDGTIGVSLFAADHLATLTVQDTGVGIAADVLPHVFDRFVQGGATPHAMKGLGLGLAIAKHIVDAHGGRIDASSDGPTKGARMTVTLPLTETPAAAPPAPAPVSARGIQRRDR